MPYYTEPVQQVVFKIKNQSTFLQCIFFFCKMARKKKTKVPTANIASQGKFLGFGSGNSNSEYIHNVTMVQMCKHTVRHFGRTCIEERQY